MKTGLEQSQCELLDAIRGTKGNHSELAKQCEQLGLSVDEAGDDNERSLIRLIGVWNTDGSDVTVGEIVGDADAVIL